MEENTYYQVDIRNSNGEYIAQDEVVSKKNLFKYLESMIDEAEEISIIKNSNRLKLSGGMHMSPNLYDDPYNV